MKRALLVIDHGSRRDGAGAALAALVAQLREIVGPAVYVEGAHMEFAAPTVADGFAQCVAAGATEIIVHPFMLASGSHVTRDIPGLVSAAAADHPGVRYTITDPLGPHPKLAEIVLERAGWGDDARTTNS